MGKHYLNVDGKKVLTTEITYEDLVMLYKQYIEKFNEVPVFSKCTLKNNMPQGRIINKIISNKGITYNDFLLQFGKVSHVRTESKDYDYYVNRFIKLCSDHVLKIQDLINNEYGLPNANWFIKYCPDKNVKTYNDFIKWCGLKENNQAFDKNYISDCLVKLQNELQRPITQKDITKKSDIYHTVIKRRIRNNAYQLPPCIADGIYHNFPVFSLKRLIVNPILIDCRLYIILIINTITNLYLSGMIDNLSIAVT